LNYADRNRAPNGKVKSLTVLREEIDGKKRDRVPLLPPKDEMREFSLSFPSSISLPDFDASDGADRDAVLDAAAEIFSSLSRIVPLLSKVFPRLGIATSRILVILRQMEAAARNREDLDIGVLPGLP
jgi:hypothetical protein